MDLILRAVTLFQAMLLPVGGQTCPWNSASQRSFGLFRLVQGLKGLHAFRLASFPDKVHLLIYIPRPSPV